MFHQLINIYLEADVDTEMVSICMANLKGDRESVAYLLSFYYLREMWNL